MYDYHLRVINGYIMRVDTVCNIKTVTILFQSDEETVTPIRYEKVEGQKVDEIREYLRMATENNGKAIDEKDVVLMVTMLAKIREIISKKD
jgi:hypothetical protein